MLQAKAISRARSTSPQITAKIELELLNEKITHFDAAREDNLSQGMRLDALRMLEASCELKAARLDRHGVGGVELERARQALATEYNSAAMLALQVRLTAPKETQKRRCDSIRTPYRCIRPYAPC